MLKLYISIGPKTTSVEVIEDSGEKRSHESRKFITKDTKLDAILAYARRASEYYHPAVISGDIVCHINPLIIPGGEKNEVKRFPLAGH